MPWKLIAATLILFWAVMTGLLLRTVYYPEHSLMAEVPPQRVLELFLDQASTRSNSLHLFHRDEFLGQANLSALKLRDRTSQTELYRMMISGGIETAVGKGGQRVTAAWRIEADLDAGGSLQRLDAHLTAPKSGHTLDLHWRGGTDTPVIEVRQGGQLLLDAQAAFSLATSMGAISPFGGLMIDPATAVPGDVITMVAREGLMDLAGKKRRCYVLEINLMDHYPLKALFTEVGELARVDLPQGYRLLEPLVFGLAPDLVEN